VHPGGSLFIGFLRGFFVGPHVTTLADHHKMRSGSPSHFTLDFASVRFSTILRGDKRDRDVQA
jgi:hypothetical protein